MQRNNRRDEHETFIAKVPFGDKMAMPHANSEKLMKPSPFSSNKWKTLSTKKDDLHPSAFWNSLHTHKVTSAQTPATGAGATLNTHAHSTRQATVRAQHGRSARRTLC